MFKTLGWQVREGETIYGFVYQLLASPDSSFSIDKVLNDFYNSEYFKVTGVKPIKKVGF